MKEKRRKGVRVAVLAADGFEQIEVTVPRRALEMAGADVRILSLRPGRIRGVNFIARGRKLYGAIACSAYAMPAASVKATSCAAVAPASRVW